MWASKASVPPRHRSPGPAQVPASHPGGIPGAIPRTHNALDPVLHRNDVEGFLDGLRDLVQPLAAARADVALDIDYDIDARQMLRKLPPVASRRSLSTALRSIRQPASGYVVVGR